jgi:DNA-binding response OmpR family regulator
VGVLSVNETKLAKHVIVVDDDPAMRKMIAEYLEDAGLRVSGAADGEALTRLIDRAVPDLVILDLKLERENGLDLMRRLAERSAVPVIVITGHRRDEADRILGLELGADDYLTKPFGLRELLARVRAVLRRSMQGERRARAAAQRTRYRFADWLLDMRTRRLTSPAGRTVPLTAGEFNLLAAFLRAPRHVLSRDQLLEATRMHEQEVFDRSVDVQILRLRRKLEIDPRQPQLIRTERGAGYVFTAPVEVL